MVKVCVSMFILKNISWKIVDKHIVENKDVLNIPVRELMQQRNNLYMGKRKIYPHPV